MISSHKVTSLIALLLYAACADCQEIKKEATDFVLTVLNERSQPAEAATVELLKENKLVKAAITDEKGVARFEKIAEGSYTFSITGKGYHPKTSDTYRFPSDVNTGTIILKPASSTLQEVSFTARKPFIQHRQGKLKLNENA